MLQISPKTQDLNFSEDMNDLLCEIDTWLSGQAKNRLDGDRFGAKVCLNIDDFELLNKYRDILYRKAKNSFCLKDYNVDDIISRIKQLLNRN